MARSARKKRAPAKKMHAWVVLSCVIVFLSYLYLSGDYGLIQHWKLHQQRSALERELEALQLEQDRLRVVLRKLETDSSFMAKIAREKFNMGLTDEEILRVIQKKDEK